MVIIYHLKSTATTSGTDQFDFGDGTDLRRSPHVQVCLLQVSQVIQSDYYWTIQIGNHIMLSLRDYEIFSVQTIGLFVDHQPPRSRWLDDYSCVKALQLVRDILHNPPVCTPPPVLPGVPVVVPPPPQHVLHSLVPSKLQGPL